MMNIVQAPPEESKEREKYTRLKERVNYKINKKKQAQDNKKTLMAQTTYLGTLGLLLVIPIVGGAYLGHWLDQKLTGFSTSWTVTGILLGVFVGALNAYLFVKERSES